MPQVSEPLLVGSVGQPQRSHADQNGYADDDDNEHLSLLGRVGQ